MFTPQQIEQVSFSRATFGGYDMQSVDEFLEPLTEDYITLYKENALLKSKMRILVSKLEEYRNNEASIKEAIANTQVTCDQMVQEAEAKCAAMLGEANQAAAVNTRNTQALIAEEEGRVEQAKRTATAHIEELEKQLKACLEALAQIRTANSPAEPVKQAPVEKAKSDDATVVADEIALNLAAMIGETEETAPKAEPKHPSLDATTKFTSLKFGPNYDPTR